MNRGLFVALALLPLAACECGKAATSPQGPALEPPRGLRVPVPDGWRGVPSRDGLEVGPPGRVVLVLESTKRPLPTLDALVAAVSAEQVEVLEKESTDAFVAVRYALTASGVRQEAFLGVRQAGPNTVWCSTAGGARGDEVEKAMSVCSAVAWEESP